MFFWRRYIYPLYRIGSKLISGILCLALLFVNVLLSFADFAQDGSETFTASVTMPGFSDADYDGMSDAWETQYGLSPDDPDDADIDSNNDGITNLEEYRQDANPLAAPVIEASIDASTLTGVQPLDVNLTANIDRNDSGYDIVKYEWDFDGNGTYDYSSTEPAAVYKFTTAGETNVKLRVTNEMGQSGVASALIDIIRAASTPEAEADLLGAEVMIPAPITLSGQEAGDIGVYQWDFDGNGEYNFNSAKSTSARHTYADVKRRSFNAHFKVTGKNGLSDLAVVYIDINSSAWYTPGSDKFNSRPKIFFPNGYVITGRKAGEEIPLYGYGAPVSGNDFGYAKKLEWDFEGDGIYDWATVLINNEWSGNTSGNANVSHVYGSPGIYRPALRVTTDANVTATDHILVIIEASPGNAPNAVAKVMYKNRKITSIDAPLPARVEFLHKGTSGTIRKFEWDFDGDKRIDYTTADRNVMPVYVYTKPGHYLATLTVTDKNNLTDTAYVPVFVYIDPAKSTYASIITDPGENSVIAGNSVTLTCNIFPDNVTADDVIFQYSIDGETWANIEGKVKPKASYMIKWNTKNIVDGNYYIRAIIAGETSSDFSPLSVHVGNNRNSGEIDIYEDDSSGVYTKEIELDCGQANEIILSDGTKIDIPMGALSGNEKLVITQSSESAGTGLAINIDIEGEDDFIFLNDITITLSYPDENDDGIIDGTDRDENDVVIMWKNSQGIWEPIYDCVVYPDENYVTGRVNHLSLFGAGFLGAGSIAAAAGVSGSSSSKGGVSYCFIATAAYGSSDCKDVMTLRRFRDKFLLTNSFGKNFVACYYKYSPKMADYIRNKPALRKTTRMLLKPLVYLAKVSLKKGD
ncbi:MAG: PKD domain-containing protein [Candidatus Omnitrophica bacterium]|nr:PKD domain-containing protein [Candidatus Omnitrophota bacterium]